MTIRELYIFAQSHALLDKSIGLVIDEYIKHISVHNNTLAHSNIMNNQNSVPMSKSNTDYKTILSSIITLCNTDINYILFWGIISSVLIVWCNKHLTIREVAKFSGYNIFYKYINK